MRGHSSSSGHVEVNNVSSHLSVIWQRHHVIDKGTFLEVSVPLAESPVGWQLQRGCFSDPTSSRSSSNVSVRTSSSTGLYDHLLFGSDSEHEGTEKESGKKEAGQEPKKVQDEEQEEQRGAQERAGGPGTGSRPPEKKRMRRSLSKRRRYEALVTRMEEIVSCDPAGFNYSTVELPLWVQGKDHVKLRLGERMEKFRIEVLQRRAQQGHGASA